MDAIRKAFFQQSSITPKKYGPQQKKPLFQYNNSYSVQNLRQMQPLWMQFWRKTPQKAIFPQPFDKSKTKQQLKEIRTESENTTKALKTVCTLEYSYTKHNFLKA